MRDFRIGTAKALISIMHLSRYAGLNNPDTITWRPDVEPRTAGFARVTDVEQGFRL